MRYSKEDHWSSGVRATRHGDALPMASRTKAAGEASVMEARDVFGHGERPTTLLGHPYSSSPRARHGPGEGVRQPPAAHGSYVGGAVQLRSDSGRRREAPRFVREERSGTHSIGPRREHVLVPGIGEAVAAPCDGYERRYDYYKSAPLSGSESRREVASVYSSGMQPSVPVSSFSGGYDSAAHSRSVAKEQYLIEQQITSRRMASKFPPRPIDYDPSGRPPPGTGPPMRGRGFAEESRSRRPPSDGSRREFERPVLYSSEARHSEAPSIRMSDSCVMSEDCGTYVSGSMEVAASMCSDRKQAEDRGYVGVYPYAGHRLSDARRVDARALPSSSSQRHADRSYHRQQLAPHRSPVVRAKSKRSAQLSNPGDVRTRVQRGEKFERPAHADDIRVPGSLDGIERRASHCSAETGLRQAYVPPSDIPLPKFLGPLRGGYPSYVPLGTLRFDKRDEKSADGLSEACKSLEDASTAMTSESDSESCSVSRSMEREPCHGATPGQ